MTIDPYVYPGSDVLKNKLNIRDAKALERVELELTYARAQQPLPAGNFDYNHLKAIHHHYFSCLYEWAGEERQVGISKNDDLFALPERIEPSINHVFHSLAKENYLCHLDLPIFTERAAYYFNELNAVHPFREGNGRTLRVFFDQLATKAHYVLDWSKVSRDFYVEASVQGFQGEHSLMGKVFSQIAKPMEQRQALQHLFTSGTAVLLQNYLEKQIQLTELVHQKNESLVQDPKLAKRLSQEVIALSQELKGIAKELTDKTNKIDKSEIRNLLKQHSFVSLQKQGGFAAIYERFQKNEMAAQDVLVVLRHAKSNSQSISRSHDRGRGRGDRCR